MSFFQCYIPSPTTFYSCLHQQQIFQTVVPVKQLVLHLCYHISDPDNPATYAVELHEHNSIKCHFFLLLFDISSTL